ncbi:MAG: bifunctional precorrin-2 dehydrogenase/sirohydrochlorin ferrochelatase [Ruminococcus sp.]|nr:bifunctional precorrin-2 dehydrogenase/sirohydrochlorin ferrochelatase [Ruminococcus sp.]
MGYFPFFMDISGRKCVIAGGGTVAFGKIEKILPFGADITVIAPEICREITEMPVSLKLRDFIDSDIDGAFMAIAATNVSALNHHIFELCSEKNILCNSVDDIENCSFIFPALVSRNDITIGISSGGTSPTFAKYMKEKITDILDDRMLETAEILKRCRQYVISCFDTEIQRKNAMKKLLDFCIEGRSLPDDEMIIRFLEDMKN